MRAAAWRACAVGRGGQMSGNPARFSSALKEAMERLRKPKGLPADVQKKRPLSSRRSPILSLSVFWPASWGQQGKRAA